MPIATPFHLMGWIDDPRRHVVAARFGTLAVVAPQLLAAPPSGDVLLYKAWTDVLGHEPPYAAQTIGDCVSQGHGHANDLLQCIEMGLSGSDLDYRETFTEFLYGAGRKVGHMLGPEDGCIGAYMVKAMTTVGMLPRSVVPDGAYSGRRAGDWGWHGPPADLESQAAGFKLGNATLVTTWAELAAALGNGYPVTICSDQGFTMTRDQEGICEAHGTWGHCMGISGLIGQTAVIDQSWGPHVPDGPLVLGMPSFSFRARRPVVERILAQGDSFALSSSPAFATKILPSSWLYSHYV